MKCFDNNNVDKIYVQTQDFNMSKLDTAKQQASWFHSLIVVNHALLQHSPVT